MIAFVPAGGGTPAVADKSLLVNSRWRGRQVIHIAAARHCQDVSLRLRKRNGEAAAAAKNVLEVTTLQTKMAPNGGIVEGLYDGVLEEPDRRYAGWRVVLPFSRIGTVARNRAMKMSTCTPAWRRETRTAGAEQRYGMPRPRR